MNPTRLLLLCLLALTAGLTPAPTRAGSPSAALSWQASREAGAERSLLLVLERGEEGWALVDARRAAVAPKSRRGEGRAEGPHFALVDADGSPLLIGRLDVPARLHGPVLGEDGEMRCTSVPNERPTVALRLPLPEATAALLVFEAADFAPREGAEIAAALAARGRDAGLTELARFDLSAAIGGSP